MTARIFAILVFVTVLVLTLLKFCHRGSGSPADEIATTSSKEHSLPREREKEIFQAPRAPIAIENPEVSEACKAYWNELRAIDFRELTQFPPKADLLPSSENCATVPQSMANIHSKLLASCQGIESAYHEDMSETDWKVLSSQCYESLYLYRAMITDFATQQIPYAQMTDPRLVSDKLILRFEESPAKGKEAAKRLLELEPEMMAAKKALFISEFDDALKNASGSGDEKWLAVSEALDRLRDSDDPEILEMRIGAEIFQYGDPDRVEQVAEEISKNHPERGVGPYNLAWAANKKGNREEAIRWVEEAIRRDPSDPRYRQTLSTLQQASGGGR